MICTEINLIFEKEVVASIDPPSWCLSTLLKLLTSHIAQSFRRHKN